ncbi:hypothetical protein BX600DRAFT_433053 [Xylariales sp. PMI_506]|nr:hypothetical protein BX600DRAFT_433053 [Xylariales sp. PMI_506]
MSKAPKPTSQRTNLVRRACDSCKIRKIKCSETSPCSGCISSGIACTFNRVQGTRGPRSLRAKTIQKISAAQVNDGKPALATGREQQPPAQLGTGTGARAGFPPPLEPRVEAAPSLLQVLDIYHQRLYPIWPIVDVQKLKEGLSARVPQLCLLANAVKLATTAQLRLHSVAPGEVPRTSLEDHNSNLDLDGLRVAFFMHIYHENDCPGGGKSLLYLRQAITISQVMRLERETSYAGLPESEQQVRRRIAWLLFVTERGVAMLHKLPVILKPDIMLPTPGVDDQAHILPAFLKLVNLFWVFDQSGIFDILQNQDSDVSNFTSTARGCLDLLQTRLQDSAADYESSNDVQKADIFITRQWMRAVVWRAAVRLGMATRASSPIRIAKEFVTFMSQLPKAAIEAHGPTVEYKTYDIATAVIDAMTSNISVNPADHPEEVLQGLQRILSSSRGGNKVLLASLPIPRSPNSIIQSFDPNDPHYLEVQWPFLDFTPPLMRSPSPLTRMFLDQALGDDDAIVANFNNVLG